MNSVNLRISYIEVPEALNPGSLQGLHHQWKQIDFKTTQVVVLKQTGLEFCIGMDIHWIAKNDHTPITKEANRFIHFLTKLRSAPCITCAVVDGDVKGGGVGMVSACDLVIATASSTFQLTEGLLGLVPGIILPALLNRLSPQTIKRMVFSTKKYSATEAEKLGIVDETATNEITDRAINTVLAGFKVCKDQSVKDLKKLLEKSNGDPNTLANEGVALLNERLKDIAIKDRIQHLACFIGPK